MNECDKWSKAVMQMSFKRLADGDGCQVTSVAQRLGSCRVSKSWTTLMVTRANVEAVLGHFERGSVSSW